MHLNSFAKAQQGEAAKLNDGLERFEKKKKKDALQKSFSEHPVLFHIGVISRAQLASSYMFKGKEKVCTTHLNSFPIEILSF